MRRKRHIALFETRTKTDPYTGRDHKEALYVGALYRLDAPNAKAVRAWLPVLWLLAASAFVLGGLTNAPSSRCIYVLPFYLFMAFPLLYWGMGVVRTLRMPQTFTEVDKDAGHDRLHRSALGFAVLCGMHTAADAVFMLTGGASAAAEREWMTFFAVLLAGVLALFSLRVLAVLENAVVQTRSAKEKTGI